MQPAQHKVGCPRRSSPRRVVTGGQTRAWPRHARRTGKYGVYKRGAHLEGLWGQTIGRSSAGNRSDAHAQLLARSQRYGRSSRDGQVWRGSTSVSLMREGGVQEPQRLNWNSRSTDRKGTNKQSGRAMLRGTGCAGRTRALMMIPASKMDRLSREEMVVTDCG